MNSKEVSELLNISRTTLDRRMRRLGIKPLKLKDGSLDFSDDEVLKIKAYVPGGTNGRNPSGKCTQFYRLAVRDSKDGIFYVRHVALSYNKAMKLEKYYEEQRMDILIKKC